MKDLTRDYDYERLIEEEKEHYSQIDVTEELKEGGAHASSSWEYYWEKVAEVVRTTKYSDLAGWLSRNGRSGTDRPIEILSLGSGYCGHELAFARNMTKPYRIDCTDINQELFQQARQVTLEEGLNLDFRVEDLNFIEIDPLRYDVILAHAVIHHVINLEHLFAQLVGGLASDGILHIVDVVGKNRKLIWEDNERFANALLDLIPEDITEGRRLAVPDQAEGMEGVRQEDTLPLLREHFEPLFEHRHGAFMRFVCTDPELGVRFNPRDPDLKRYLDFLIGTDEQAVFHGVLRPLELWGVYRPLPPVAR
jgi:SAM-dependent methyltransferase